MMTGEFWTSIGSLVASFMFVWAMIQQYTPYYLRRSLDKYFNKIESILNPYIQIKFNQYSSGGTDRYGEEISERSAEYIAIQHYLEANSTGLAKRLKANSAKDSKTLVLSMDDYEEIIDIYQGIKVWWSSNAILQTTQSFTLYPRDEPHRYYTLSFHSRYRDLITKSYLSHVLDEGKAISVKYRQRKLYTNRKNKSWSGRDDKNRWFHVVFKHPANFETLALEPNTKKDIINDLITFSKAKDYYAKVGKAWKRGYLLYGPPGTGKSTMVAAMANLLQYDVYDLELTSVNDNTDLKKLLIQITEKSIIVLEDIDCSLNLTGRRKKGKDGDYEDEKDPVENAVGKNSKNDASQVTLSGLLNFIDGLWSACGGERIIVFTTNHVDNLDPALIRRGRMDKHIELSYCSFEAFKVLARNYLDIQSHELFGRIEQLLGETDMTPADVAENLMPKSAEEDGESCLKCLISALEDTKKIAIAKTEDKEKLEAEEVEKIKSEKDEKVGEDTNVEEPSAIKDVKENG